MKISHFRGAFDLLKVTGRIRTAGIPRQQQTVAAVIVEYRRIADVSIPVAIVAHTGRRSVQSVDAMDRFSNRCQIQPNDDREYDHQDVQRPRDDREEDGGEDCADRPVVGNGNDQCD